VVVADAAEEMLAEGDVADVMVALDPWASRSTRSAGVVAT
jgi:hypothetical protein